MNPNDTTTESDAPTAWRFLGQWPTIVMVSIVLLMLTFNPLLTGFFPYLRAGWPAMKTAFWLKKEDPWKARGTVGFLFHLCMALFRAGTCALVCVICTGIVASVTQKEPNLIPFMIAMATIVFGCFLSSILAWIGVVIAFLHGIRIFVISNLFAVCHGDFTVTKSLGTGHVPINPANCIIGVATAVPSLTLWFIAMLTTVAEQGNRRNETMTAIILGLLPVLGITCIVMVVFLSSRIMARSPAECWGIDPPESDKNEVSANWYRATE